MFGRPAPGSQLPPTSAQPPSPANGPGEFTRMFQGARRHAAPSPTAATRERALDLAVASAVPVGKPLELIALLRLSASRSLADMLESDRDTTLRRPDVRERKFGLDFLRDSLGRLQPIRRHHARHRPRFRSAHHREARTRPGGPRLRAANFLLTPKTTGELRIQFDLLTGPLTLTSRVLRTRAEPADQLALAAPHTLVTESYLVAVTPRPWWKRAAASAAIAAGIVALALAGILVFRRHSSPPDLRGVQTQGAAQINTAAQNIAKGKNYALLIATDKYEYLNGLRNPTRDAEAVEDELKTDYGFQTRHAYNVTRDQMLAAIKSYRLGNYGAADQLLIYIAGHGTFDDTEQRGFLMAKDSKPDDQLHTSQLSHDDLRAVVDTLPVPHILVVIDACFGGLFDPKIAEIAHRGSEYGQISIDDLRKRKLDLRTRQFLTSGSKEFVSDGRGDHSPFAQILLKPSATTEAISITSPSHVSAPTSKKPRVKRAKANSAGTFAVVSSSSYPCNRRSVSDY